MSDDGFYIIGAGGFGREVLEYALAAHAAGSGPRPLGFLDDTDEPLAGRSIPGYGVVGGVGEIGSLPVNRYVVALGSPEARFRVRLEVESAGGELVTVVHPTAVVSATASVGAGCIVGPGGVVAAWARSGRNVAMNVYASIGHDASVADDSVIGPYAGLAGWCEVGEGVEMGGHSFIAPRVRLGSWSKVSAGAVVVRDADECSLIATQRAANRRMFRPPDTSVGLAEWFGRH